MEVATIYIGLFLALILVLSPYLIFVFLKRKYSKGKYEWIHFLGYIYAIAFIALLFAFGNHTLSFEQAMIYNGMNYEDYYSPLSKGMSPFYLLISGFGLFSVYWFIFKRFRLSPIYTSYHLLVIGAGIMINVLLLVQISQYTGEPSEWSFLFYPFSILHTLLGTYLVLDFLFKEKENRVDFEFEDNLIGKLNIFLIENGHWYCIIFFLPIFIMLVVVLLLFGQEPNNVTKIFTETATWRFSNHLPPPPEQYQGHYLCTVANHGHPKIVKPLRLGKRQNHIIIVNRQLMIANAFEDIIQRRCPKCHKIIRRNYDKYGWDLSQTINNTFWATTVYLLMKPLEFFFVTVIYAFEQKPEELIHKQYQMKE